MVSTILITSAKIIEKSEFSNFRATDFTFPHRIGTDDRAGNQIDYRPLGVIWLRRNPVFGAATFQNLSSHRGVQLFLRISAS